MRKLLALVLGLSLVCAALAGAEEGKKDSKGKDGKKACESKCKDGKECKDKDQKSEVNGKDWRKNKAWKKGAQWMKGKEKWTNADWEKWRKEKTREKDKKNEK